MLEQEQQPRRQQRRVAGRYALGAELGRGGMGTVWRATDELLGREVAVKEIALPETVGGPGQDAASIRARVLREARAAARLNHPGIVTVHDVLDAPDRLFIMELVEAPSLAAVVAKEGPLPPARVARIGLGLVDALEAAHAAGIVHRDVKPGNVLLLPGDRVKLADFGIAAVQGDPQLTASKVAMGSPAFMAPSRRAAARSALRPTGGRSARLCISRWRGSGRSRASTRSPCSPPSSTSRPSRPGTPPPSPR